MLKINNLPELFMLRNAWHDEVETISGIKHLPYRFKRVAQINGEKNPSWIAVDDEKGKHSIAITEVALKYLSGEEVLDCNPGLYFKDYLPSEGSVLLVSDKNKPWPMRFILQISSLEYEGVAYPLIDLVLQDMLSDVCYTVFSKRNCIWKFIVYGNAINQAANKVNDGKTLDQKASEIAQYMNDVEKMMQDTIIHKEMVKIVCTKFANFLENTDNLKEDAELLLARAKVHDNSKLLNKDEFQALTGIINDKSCLRDAKAALSAYKQDAIELHWKNNSHHPEHHKTCTDMSRIDRYEFVCDCCARSLQYGTELIDFMKTRQEQRFHFPEIMFDEIMRYCKIAVSL